MRSRLDRFFARVAERGDCWVWTGSVDRGGYGKFGGKTVSAHRFAYESLVGEIPPGLELDHLCRNRACVNPSHLEPVTRKVNLERARDLRTTCPKGHEYTEENTIRWRNNGRRCRICEQERERRRWPERSEWQNRRRAKERA